MRAFILFVTILFLSCQGIYSQWSIKYTSVPFYDGVITGWMNFNKTDGDWENRLYYLDATSFNIMSADFSNEVQYSYNFTPEEITAGYQIYSLRADVTNDGIVDFYVMSAYGMASNYRYSFKILDITSGSTIFQRNEGNFSYSTPSVWDIDNNNILECSVVKKEWPTPTFFYQEVYSTHTDFVAFAPMGMEPLEFQLNQNYPNPFNPETTIEFNISKPSDVYLNIYDLKGSLIKTLVNRHMNEGNHKVVWDGTNNAGVKAASGMYVYSLNSGDLTDNKKMIILK
jgi:hypothetical protein